MILMNIVYAVLAAPAGALSDTLDRRMLLALGLAAPIGADLVLGLGGGLPAIIAGVALWGAHMALTQGLFGHDRRRSPAGPARNRIRPVQPCRRGGHADRQCRLRDPLDRIRATGGVPGRCWRAAQPCWQDCGSCRKPYPAAG
jgi:hypothetical protein